MIVISNINPASQALKFLESRLASDYYRGVESSQHNRYEVSDVHTILRLLDQYAPNRQILVRDLLIYPKSMTMLHSVMMQSRVRELEHKMLCEKIYSLIGIEWD